MDSWGVTRNYFDPELNRNGEIRKHEGYITELTTDAALDWMREQIEDEPLFFFATCPTMPRILRAWHKKSIGNPTTRNR